MTSDDRLQRQIQIDSRMLTWAGALAGVGGVLWVAGISLAGAALLRAGQQWLAELDQPPSALAKMKWQQLLSATAAGSDAWTSAGAKATRHR
jgi:hypothetical protein